MLDIFCEICDILQNFIFTEDSWATASDFQQRFGHIIYSSSNKSTQSPLIVFLGPLQSTVRKQFTVFFSKIFKITKFEGNILCGRGRRNEQKRIFSRSSYQTCFCKKKCSEIFGKTHRKTSVQEPFLAFRRESSFKKRLLHRCFAIKFIRAAFSSNTCEQFDNFDHHI